MAQQFRDYRSFLHIEDLRPDHDVISFDPRALDKSSTLRCDANALPAPSTREVQTQSEFDALAGANAAFAQS